MFSTYVIHAVHVMLELDKLSDPDRNITSLCITDFGIQSEMRRPMFRHVLRRLVQAHYITMSKDRKYRAAKASDEVSLLDLVTLFHGGVCIGESYDHYLAVGAERFPTKEYRRLLKYEDQVKQRLAAKWLDVPISNFQNKQGEGTEINNLL